MKVLGIILFVIGGLILGGSVIASMLMAPEGEAIYMPALIGGIIVSTFFDLGGIVVMKIMPKM